MRESKIERRVCKRVLSELGVLGYKFNSATQSGVPDRIFLIPGGKPFFIEFKAPGLDLSEKQNWVFEVFKKLGYDVEVHDDENEAYQAIKIRTMEAKAISKKRC
jgi:VRR-NUC domain